MTGRERAIRAMNFEKTDRLAIMANGVFPGFVQWLLGIGEEDYWNSQQAWHYEAMRQLGQDFHIQMWLPRREPKDKWVDGNNPDWTEDAIIADIEKRTKDNREAADQLTRDREGRIDRIMSYQNRVQAEMGDEILWVFGMDGSGPAICYIPYEWYGYEGFFTVLATDPELVAGLVAAQAEHARVHNECVSEAARRLDWPRIGYCGQDLTTQRGNMVNPKVMDKIYYPHLEHALAPLIDDGFKIIWHSDGNMNDMLQPLIDIGVAGFQGFQEECGTLIKEVASLRNRNGDPLILWGSCSVIDVLRCGTFGDIGREVQRVLEEWPHPGLCLATSSVISEDVPYENVVEFYRCCREMGRGGRSF